MEDVLKDLHFLVANEVSKLAEETEEGKVHVYITGEVKKIDYSDFYEVIIIKKDMIQKKFLQTDVIHLLEECGATIHGAMTSQEVIEKFPRSSEDCTFCGKPQ